ncbi:MAG: glycosyltransferase [Eubacteriaceae bacterium]|nr:glycosyltransferase [Eubacteriaceae bacterium]
MPKLSIIMGVYNCKNSMELKRSINSIIDQSYQDWEFIICNDGSTDNTLELLDEFKKMDSRIKVITYKDNKGLAHALNICIEASIGEYIARQDEDDISDTDRLRCQVEYLDKHPDISIVGSTARVFDDHGIWGKYEVPKFPEKEDFFWRSPFIHPVVIMRKSDLLKVNSYRVAVETRRCEDLDLFLRMYALGMKGYNIQKDLLSYKIINGNKKYRPMKYRIDEARVRFVGYKNLGILLNGLPYVFKPILIGLIPQFIFNQIRKMQY